ncbi:MAG: RagB/SusD family nutrient uptake outer membrane protein [Muribaculaceae bacterium]|nr:RagB/SusD family nutrient uptake outer membrane protein [Muribaculaceae bacterium]
MKTKIRHIIACAIFSSIALSGCVDSIAVGDGFLEKQPGVDVTIDTIFSKPEYARMFLWESYKGLYHGFDQKNCMNSSMPEAISDICHSAIGWLGVIEEYYSAMHTEASSKQWADKFSFSDSGPRKGIWSTIRACWIFIENIDRVPGMQQLEKDRLKAEAKMIIATRYYDGLRNFGGLPLVDHAYETGENFSGGHLSARAGDDSSEVIEGRATVEQTAEFIDNLLAQIIAEPTIPFAITDYTAEGGRLTKGGAYALRAKLWQFVASPIFNDETPYRQYDGELKLPVGVEIDGDPLLRVWIGRKDPSLWNKCLDACKEFFRMNESAGQPFALVQPNGETENDYRRAFRSAYFSRETSEKIIEVRGLGTGDSDGEYLLEWGSNVPGNVSHYGGHAPTLEWFNMFPWADGRNFDGQRLYNTDNAEGIDIFAGRDPRLYESMLVPQRNLNNEYNTFMDKVIDCWVGGDINTIWFVPQGYNKHGFGQFKWALDYYDLGNERYSWPYLRMADMHLTYAEALAQTGDFEGAIKEVDKVRSRVGLQSLKVNRTLNLNDKDVLIDEILRERACELALENNRLYDIIRYKKTECFDTPLHLMTIYAKDPATGDKTETPFSQMNGVWPQFIYETAEITLYARAWWKGNSWDNKWLLSPIDRDEINKGYGLFQNPGW